MSCFQDTPSGGLCRLSKYHTGEHSDKRPLKLDMSELLSEMQERVKQDMGQIPMLLIGIRDQVLEEPVSDCRKAILDMLNAAIFDITASLNHAIRSGGKSC